jgi:hypothetical protein
MNKSLFLIPLIVFSACSLAQSTPSLEYKIHEITEINEAYEITLSLSRSDLLLKQSNFEMSLTDVQNEMKVSNISLNDAPCLISEIPAKCEAEDLKKTLSLKADFPDTSLSTTLVSPSFDFSLLNPEITHPVEKDDKAVLVFEDVMADTYEIEINACYDENNCMISQYDIINEEGVWKILPRGDLTYFAEISHPGTSIKTVFKYDPSLFESVTYTVKAMKKWPSLPGISLKSEKSASVSF